MSDKPRRKRKEGFWDRLLTPSTVIGALVGAFAAFLSAVAAVSAGLLGDDKLVVLPTATPPMAAERITQCMRRHGLSTPRTTLGLPSGPDISFKRCDWPPLVKSSADGYTEVVVERTELPRGNAWNNTLDAFRGPCDRMDVTFVHVHMGERRFVSRRLAVGRLYDITWIETPRHRPVLRQLDSLPDELWEYDVPTPSADSGLLHVFYSGHFHLFDAYCAFGRAPT